MTFLLSEKSKDFNRLKKDKFNLLPFEDKSVPYALTNATYILWSKAMVKTSDNLSKHSAKSIFLGHGILSKLNNITFYLGGLISRCAKYTCCSSVGESKLVEQYSNKKLVPIECGLPRHDTLVEKTIAYRNNPERRKRVFISFHWRVGEMDNITKCFLNSTYLKTINNLLNSEKLKRIVDRGVEVIFYPHARFRKYLKYFKVPKYI